LAAARGAFDQAQRANERAREAQIADGKVVHGALGLRGVEGMGGHLDLAHAVAFDTMRLL
jgi:hypothetical protein